MSQIFKSSSTGPSPPNVPTTFVTNDGNAVPALNILNVLGQSSTDFILNGIQTTGSGNTLTVELTNTVTGSGQTVGAVSDDLITFDLGASEAVYRFVFHISGKDDVTGDGVGYTVESTARTDGATATVIATPYIDADEDASLLSSTIDFVASGNNVIVRYTGAAGQTVDLNCIGHFVRS